MPQIRIQYDESGHVLGIQHRPGERYDNVEDPEGVRAIVVDSDDIEGVPVDELTVKRGKLKTVTRESEEPPRSERVEEIRATDKSKLSDEDWLKLFREYATLTGAF